MVLCTRHAAQFLKYSGIFLRLDLTSLGGLSAHVSSFRSEMGVYRVVHPLAIKVMREMGIDLSNYQVRSLEEFHDQPPKDLVVTVWDDHSESVPP